MGRWVKFVAGLDPRLVRWESFSNPPGDPQRPVGEFRQAVVEEANPSKRAQQRAAANAADSGQAQVAYVGFSI
jgi:hypothetical protein